MRRFALLSLPVLSLVLLGVFALALPETKFLTVPKGTTVEKVGPGHIKLKAPDGCVLEIRGYQKTGPGQAAFSAVGTSSACEIRDKNGKIIATGTKGSIKSGPKTIIGDTGKALKNVPAADYVKIDDEVTWLPATIEFLPARVFSRSALEKLSPQPDPPGKK